MLGIYLASLAGSFVITTLAALAWLRSDGASKKVCEKVLLYAGTVFAICGFTLHLAKTCMVDAGLLPGWRDEYVLTAKELEADRLANFMSQNELVGADYHSSSYGATYYRQQLRKLLRNKKDNPETPGLALRREIFAADDGHKQLPPQIASHPVDINTTLGNSWFRYIYLKKTAEAANDMATAASLKEGERRSAYILTAKLLYNLGENLLAFLIGLVSAIWFIVIACKKKLFPLTPDAGDSLAQCTIAQVYRLLLLFMYLRTTSIIAVSFAFRQLNQQLHMSAFFVPVLFIAMICIAILLAVAAKQTVCVQNKIPLRQLFFSPAEKTFAKHLIWCLGAYYTLRALYDFYCLGIFLATKHIQGLNNEIALISLTAFSQGDVLSIIALGFVSVIIGPIIEEIIFRRLIYGTLRSRLGIVGSACISAALFSVAHMDAEVLLTHFVFGLVMAITYERTRCLSTCIFIHMMWNATTLMMTWLSI